MFSAQCKSKQRPLPTSKLDSKSVTVGSGVSMMIRRLWGTGVPRTISKTESGKAERKHAKAKRTSSGVVTERPIVNSGPRLSLMWLAEHKFLTHNSRVTMHANSLCHSTSTVHVHASLQWLTAWQDITHNSCVTMHSICETAHQLHMLQTSLWWLAARWGTSPQSPSH